MLPYIVVAMAVIYVVLHYAGFFEGASDRLRDRGSSSGGDEPKGDVPTLADEAERRLQVFEDFLRGGDRPQEGDD